jgi:eukaryotic-like serine/threonine-protein kinase
MGAEGTPQQGSNSRSHAPERASLAPVGTIRGSLTTLEVLKGRGDQRAVLRKRLAVQHADDPAAQAALAAAGHLGMRASAPELVRTLAVREGPDGFVALEYVEGLDLAQLLSAAPGPEALRALVPVVLDVLRGLSALHQLHSDAEVPVVHQAPVARHILVGVDGHARLCDFAHVASHALPSSPERQRFLRPAEMSPEQASGSGHIDQRSDLFSVGVVIWEWLTGERLFAGPTQPETLAKVLRAPILPPSQSGARTARFDALCTRALMRVRVGRYGSAAEMADELTQLSADAASRAEVGAWVKRALEQSGPVRESQTLLRPSPAPTARSSTPTPERARIPSERGLSRPIVEVGPSPRSSAPDPRVEALDPDGDDAPTLARAGMLDEVASFAETSAPTRARPGLAEQLASGLRGAGASLEDEPTRARATAEDRVRARSLFDTELEPSPAFDSSPGSDSVPLPSFFSDRGESERDDPTTPRLSSPGAPRVISAVFGGPMPSVLGQGADWSAETVREPRSSQSPATTAVPTVRSRGWLWSAMLAALAMTAMFGLYVAFGGRGEGHDAPPHGPADALDPASLTAPPAPLLAPSAAPPEPARAAQPASPAAAATARAVESTPGASPAASVRPAPRWQARKAGAARHGEPPAAPPPAPAPAPAARKSAAELPDNPY